MIIQTVLPNYFNLTFHDHSLKHVLTGGFEVYVALIIWSQSLLLCTDVFISKVTEWHILKIEAADVSETSVPICLTTWHHIPEGSASSLCCRSGSSVSLPDSSLRSLVTVVPKQGELLKFNFVFDYTTRKPRKALKETSKQMPFRANSWVVLSTMVLSAEKLRPSLTNNLCVESSEVINSKWEHIKITCKVTADYIVWYCVYVQKLTASLFTVGRPNARLWVVVSIQNSLEQRWTKCAHPPPPHTHTQPLPCGPQSDFRNTKEKLLKILRLIILSNFIWRYFVSCASYCLQHSALFERNFKDKFLLTMKCMLRCLALLLRGLGAANWSGDEV
jgi:hypothetical protein